MNNNDATNNNLPQLSKEELKKLEDLVEIPPVEKPETTAYMPDSHSSIKKRSKVYEAILGESLAEGFKLMNLLMLLVAFVGIFTLQTIQFGGNGGDRFAYGYGYAGEDGSGTGSDTDTLQEIIANNNITTRGLISQINEIDYKPKEIKSVLRRHSNKSGIFTNKHPRILNKPTENKYFEFSFRDSYAMTNTTNDSLFLHYSGHGAPELQLTTNISGHTLLQDTAYKFQIETDLCSTAEFKSKFCYDIKNNQVFTVHFKAIDKTQGYQFTLNHPGLEMIDITPGEHMGLDNFGVFAQQETITTSWNGDNIPEFSIKFRAKKDGKLNELLSISSRITKAIAYDYTRAKPMKLAFVYGNDKPVSTAPERFNLYQNTPNPFKDKTAISFDLPEAGAVTLTVTDKTGRTLLTREGQYPDGYNTIVVERNMLPDISTDVLFYTVKTATASATKKMDMEIK